MSACQDALNSAPGQPPYGTVNRFRLARRGTDVPPLWTAPVLTGHKSGVITISVVEADDVQREKRRLQLHEPYRTLLGHFRHEIGHYYWDQLIHNGDRINPFRQLFGDERDNYNQAVKQHYERGAPEDWQQRFVSAYASSHPWEDWAETWAHYLCMTDLLETAAACGLSLRPGRPDEPSLQSDADGTALKPFDRMMDDWFPLTYALTNLNRSLGLPDGYPFVLSTAAIDKLRFVHEAIAEQRGRRDTAYRLSSRGSIADMRCCDWTAALLLCRSGRRCPSWPRVAFRLRFA